MNLIFTSDIHDDKDFVDEIYNEIEKDDYLFILGDFTFFGELKSEMFKKFKKKTNRIFIIPGNHEDDEAFYGVIEKYNLGNIHNNFVEIGDTIIVGYGDSFESDPDFDENIKELERLENKIKKFKRKILITHIHPAIEPFKKISNFVEPSKTLVDIIKKNNFEFHFFGHAHEASSMRAKYNKTQLHSCSNSIIKIKLD